MNDDVSVRAALNDSFTDDNQFLVLSAFPKFGKRLERLALLGEGENNNVGINDL